jgi:hypothetical protein
VVEGVLVADFAVVVVVTAALADWSPTGPVLPLSTTWSNTTPAMTARAITTAPRAPRVPTACM